LIHTKALTAVIIGTSIVLIITSALMVLLVLLHKGKGGGLSDLFGGGISSSLGGSSVVERNLDRLTIGTGVIWFLSIIALGLLFAHGHHG
jgi:preprotein translocase subunit SecG